MFSHCNDIVNIVTRGWGGGIQREKKLVLIICIVSFDHLFEADPKSWTICTIQDKDGIAYLLKSRVK